MTALNDYYDMLLQHDWFYEYSDDHQVWKRGSENRKTLGIIAEESPAHKDLLHGFIDHHFSGAPWGTEKRPMPARPGVKLAKNGG